MNGSIKKIQFLSTILVIAGALIKVFHIHPSGDYFVWAGLFLYGVSGIADALYSSEKNFNSYARLIASAALCIAIILDLLLATNLLPFAIIFLVISFISSILPNQKITK